MFQRAVWIGLAFGLLMSMSGCGLLRAVIYYPFDGTGSCGPSGGVCEEPCGPVGCATGAACGPCDDGPGGDDCQVDCGGCGNCRRCLGYLGWRRWQHGCRRGPAAWIHHLFSWGACCNNGCGELYCGDWSDSPDRCDPCDRGGNWTGQGCAYGPGCKRCGQGGYGGPVMDGPMIDDGYAMKGPPNGGYAMKGAPDRGSVVKGSTRIVSQTDRAVRPAGTNVVANRQVAATQSARTPTPAKPRPKYQTAQRADQEEVLR